MVNDRTLPFVTLILFGLLAAAVPVSADDWPQWRGPQRDGVWREEGVVEQFPPEGPPVRWRTPVGAGFSGPAVAGGRVFLMDRVVDENASADVKTQWNYRDKTGGQERVLCLDEATGEVLWKYAYPCQYETAYGSGPRATPTVCGDRVYVLGAMGDLVCLDTATGGVVWQKNFVRDYGADVPLYGFASAPLVDGDRLIVMVGGEGQVVMALDRHTGQEVWKAGTASEPGYCAPLIHTFSGVRQLIIWHTDGLMGLVPESGQELWSIKHPATAGVAISTPAIADNRLVVCSQYEGVLMLEFRPGVAQPTVLWQASAGTAPERQWKTAGFNTTMGTVLLVDDHIYGVSLYGETCCLSADDGHRVWTTLQPTSGGTEPRERWSTLFMVPHGDSVFIWNDHGDLILARLTAAGYQEISRAHLLEPDMMSAGSGGRGVAWSHPAFANRCCYVRNNHEIICVSLERKRD
jgi:outer membrane protein assembly factor BamB